MKNDNFYFDLSNEFFDGLNAVSGEDMRNQLGVFLKEKITPIVMEKDDSKKRMAQMYNAIRDASLKFLLYSNISNEDKELFKEFFKYYINNL